ncbi:VOC family protein [Methylobacterium oryzihabitans]|uniref:VOC family protein n=1 Tax=Methylobacterium oryzihabitans TaxID=2499852 RepID=A0A3S2XPI6_9HYPH|nr:VOC family protein [Methylobacterium oryzihabitans]RVU19811.1 VOC family protein [Methylobacterium oryzihabitans]
MPLSLDHLVIAVADLDRAFADYAALGFTVIRGGEHANGITHNVLVVLEDGSYLELISFRRPQPGDRWSDVYHRAGEGFLDHALLPDDIDAVAAAAQARGLDIADPVSGGRLRPDGARLDWKIARSPGSDVPFLCGDVTPRALRVQEGDVRRHRNGVTGLAALTVAVRDVEAARARYAALLGAGADAPVVEAVVAGTAARTATLPLGPGVAVTLASPAGAGGDLAAALAARGEGPFAAVFRAPDGHGDLDPALTHGARLSVAGGFPVDPLTKI